jgi:hypothetical protein
MGALLICNMDSYKQTRQIYPLSYMPLQGPRDKLTDGPFVIAKGFESRIVRLTYKSMQTYAYAVGEPTVDDDYIYVTDYVIDALGIDQMFAEITISDRSRRPHRRASYSSDDSSPEPR